MPLNKFTAYEWLSVSSTVPWEYKNVFLIVFFSDKMPQYAGEMCIALENGMHNGRRYENWGDMK